jgi:hypothetical protein
VREVEEAPVLGARAAGQQVVEESRVGLVEEGLLGKREPGEPRRPERVLAGRELEGGGHRHHRPRQRLGPHLRLDRPGQLREDPPRHLPGRVVLARGGGRVERLAPQPHLGLRGVEDLPTAQQTPAPRLAGAPPHPPLPRRHLRHHGREQRARDRPVGALLPHRQHRDRGVGVALEQRERVHDGDRGVRRSEVDAHVVAGILEPAFYLPAPAASEGRRQGRRRVGLARGCRPRGRLRFSGTGLSRHLAPSRGTGFERERGRSARGSDDQSPGLSSRSRVSRTVLPQQVRSVSTNAGSGSGNPRRRGRAKPRRLGYSSHSAGGIGSGRTGPTPP